MAAASQEGAPPSEAGSAAGQPKKKLDIRIRDKAEV